MIEINLVPDVKQELIRAQRVRTMVVSGSILSVIITGGLIVLLVSYVYGVQAIRSTVSSDSIKKEQQKLTEVTGLPNALTVQHQLTELSPQHDEKNITSRMFDILNTIVPTDENKVVVKNFSIVAEDKVVTVEGEAENGFLALEAFKKTIEATKFQYRTEDDSKLKTVPLTLVVSDGERNYGQTQDGKRVLRFSINFEYSSEIFDRTSLDGKIIAPNRSNATDSALAVPSSLFTNTGGGQ